MAKKGVNVISIYPSDDLMADIQNFKVSGRHKSLSAAAISILSQYFRAGSTVESTVDQTVFDKVMDRLRAVEVALTQGVGLDIQDVQGMIDTAFNDRDERLDSLETMVREGALAQSRVEEIVASAISPLLERFAVVESKLSAEATVVEHQVLAQPKASKRSPKAKLKYTRAQLEALKITDVRKIYRSEIAVAARSLDPSYAGKADMIDAILMANILA